MNRRDALKVLAAGSALGALSSGCATARRLPEESMDTYVYKAVRDCQIKADVYQASGGNARRPVVLTIHGGALIMGGRYPIQMDLFEPLLRDGIAVVSIDYRLAPETKLPEIIRDIQDAYRWIRQKGPELFGADPDRIAVQGGSAGGYLTLMTGFCVETRPKALVSFYGYGDIAGDWYTKPDPFYSKQPAVTKEAAYSAVGEGVPCGFPQGRRRGEFYLYCRQNGLWTKEVAGIDPATHDAKLTPYCPVRNVTREYPPTLLAHGDQDTDVPYAQSALMNDALGRVGVEHEFLTLHGAGHGFSHSNHEEYKAAINKSIAFLATHLSA